MSRLKYTLFFISLLFLNLTFAQEFRLTGSLINQADNSPLPGATVKLMSKRDTTQMQYSSSGGRGEFVFEKLARGPFRLEVTYIGFEKYIQDVFAGGKTENIGTITIKPSSTSLGEFNINGTAIRAEQKGDTTQYNADAFKVTKDANTEDLIKKMPGITIENGTVKAHGEDVKRVLVDGKQFFGDDPSVTLKNLPAEVVDKIQVFDKLSDQAAWTGFDDGSGQKTINIVTRNAKNTGQFGKFSAGYGTDGHYLVGANVNFFKGQRRITLLGMSNNVNQQNFSAEDVIGSGSGGRQQGMPGGRSGGSPSMQVGPQSGVFNTNAIGVNYTDAWGSKLTLNASYFWNQGENTTNKQVNRQYIQGGEVSQYYNELSSSKTDNSNHRLNMRIEYSPDSSNSFILTPRLSVQDNTSNSTTGARTALDPDLANLLNQSINNNNGKANGYNFTNDLLFRHKFHKKGRTFSIDLGTGLSNRYKDNYLLSLSDYYGQAATQTSDSARQYGKSLSDGLNLSSNLVYTEPLGKNSQLQFNYNLSRSQNKNDLKTYDYVTEKLDYTAFDTLLSNIYQNDYITHRLGSGYLYQTEKVSLNLGLTYQYAELKGNTSFPYIDSTSKSFNSVLPNVMLNYKFSKYSNLRVSYRASTNAPSTGQLQQVIDNSNPLLLTTGNPSLQQEIRHFGMSRFSLSNKAKTANLFGMLFFQKTLNYIGNSTFIAHRDTIVNGHIINRGTQVSKPENLDGAWNTRFLVTVGFPFKPIKSNLNFNTGVSYNRLPSRINAQSNFSNTYGINLGGVLSSNISDKLDFTLTYNLTYNLVENSIQPQLNNNYFFQIGSAQLNWEFWKGFFVQSSVTYQNYNGISTNITDQYTLWNVNVGKKLFKKKNGEIKLSGYDILDENKSLNRNVTDTYIEDSNTEVLRQYFMLSFTYNLRNFTGKGPGEERHDFEGRPDFHMH
ncbi:MAG: TonB-dependent receptor [Bacteroidota bacterium]